ncbi:hypothetical protein PHJA_001212200 [Phtheirospermum japonicum]|uniref:Uncharacterized protein n=1 Tax=Phtheirospermum japonicum TaxID=374723 RepID=A0A830C8X2_9LAMI|nr:hypothetical protein PHJA_001212200 [Phtheirospermum japonicum]
MAAAIFRAKIASPLTVSRRRLERFFTNQKRDSSSASTDIPLLQTLLKAQISSIQATLDSELSYYSTEFPWTALLSSLNTHAPQKANLDDKAQLGLIWPAYLNHHTSLIRKTERSNHVLDGSVMTRTMSFCS